MLAAVMATLGSNYSSTITDTYPAGIKTILGCLHLKSVYRNVRLDHSPHVPGIYFQDTVHPFQVEENTLLVLQSER